MLHRREVVRRLLRDRGEDLLVVSGLGSPTWDVAAAGDHARNFHFIGVMGQAGPFALGLAMAQSGKRVLLFTGDGELLMGLGALATIANVAPSNLAIVVLDNEAYAETGGQPTATRGVTDLAAVAQGCGFRSTRSVTLESELDELAQTVVSGRGPLLAVVKIAIEELPMKFPFSFDGVTAIDRFRAALE